MLKCSHLDWLMQAATARAAVDLDAVAKMATVAGRLRKNVHRESG
jgi:hypothetical protein